MSEHKYLTRDEAADRTEALIPIIGSLPYEGPDSVRDIIALKMAVQCLRHTGRSKRSDRSSDE